MCLHKGPCSRAAGKGQGLFADANRAKPSRALAEKDAARFGPVRKITGCCPTFPIDIIFLTKTMAPVAEKTQSAPATHKQPSRKGKKAWRKNVDITELQAGVEDVREQIIQGYESV